MAFIHVVSDVLDRKHKDHEIEVLDEFLKYNEVTIKDLDECSSLVFRTRWITHDNERVILFNYLYKMYCDRKAYMKFADPFNGMQNTNIKNLEEFKEKYTNSIFSFVALL